MMDTMEGIHIINVNTPLNRNVGKVDIAKVFNELLCIKCSSITPLSRQVKF